MSCFVAKRRKSRNTVLTSPRGVRLVNPLNAVPLSVIRTSQVSDQHSHPVSTASRMASSSWILIRVG